MMRHHETAARAFAASVASDPGVLGVVLVGSVARGTERPDSDVDLYLVVAPDRWDHAVEQGRVMFVERRGVDYPGGYLDVKTISRDALVAGSRSGDGPLRASFEHGLVLHDADGDLGGLIAAVTDTAERDWDDDVLMFLAQLRLQAGYFLDGAERDGDPLLLRSAATHALLAAHRALLAHAHRFFRGSKYLTADIAALGERPEGWDRIVDDLLDRPTAAAGRALIAAVDAHCGTALTDADALSRYVLDTEYAWWRRTPVPEYS